MSKLSGKRALITGGSSGLGESTSIWVPSNSTDRLLRTGAAIASLLSQSGCVVAINYASNATRAEETLSKLNGKGHVIVQGDAFSKEGITSVVERTVDALGGVDIVISNAGWTKFAPFNDLNSVDDADWMRCYETNVLSHLWLLQQTETQLRVSKGCFIISASVAGLKPSGSSMAYSVSKSATIHLAKSLAKACAPDIRVNSVAPGILLTDWTKGFSEEQKAKVVESNALGRMTDVQDVAELVVMLVKNESMTGQNIEISAGFQL